jgi:hypothetical protein
LKYPNGNLCSCPRADADNIHAPLGAGPVGLTRADDCGPVGDRSMFIADDWRGPYRLVTRGACGGGRVDLSPARFLLGGCSGSVLGAGEDPFIFVDGRGHYHCLYHREPITNPDIAIGHAYSSDGYDWHVSDNTAANSTIHFQVSSCQSTGG